MKFNTITADLPSGKPFGSRKDAVLKKLFATSPLYQGPDSDGSLAVVEGYSTRLRLTDDQLKSWFFQNVVDTPATDSGVGVPTSGDYYGVNGGYSMNYEGVPGNGPPDMNEVNEKSTGGGGLPATAFVPNPASPGADPNGGTNTNFTTIPASPEFAAALNSKTPDTFGSGKSSPDTSRNPSVTSAKIGKSSGATLTLGQSLASLSGKTE